MAKCIIPLATCFTFCHEPRRLVLTGVTVSGAVGGFDCEPDRQGLPNLARLLTDPVNSRVSVPVTIASLTVCFRLPEAVVSVSNQSLTQMSRPAWKRTVDPSSSSHLDAGEARVLDKKVELMSSFEPDVTPRVALLVRPTICYGRKATHCTGNPMAPPYLECSHCCRIEGGKNRDNVDFTGAGRRGCRAWSKFCLPTCRTA
ncbi:hypothetical protein B0H67DRAFT_95946 [Lasiosphaeris hirsuta]|uniref:Uncharacterized protein n=1 Tax=Lasiosphaeris hirsuta TaxID=260670 RepID=A0AA40EED4_9PEZI|nr:hypothetical protein B0H67DRAFT_95946 [Lasiosphaeris hirsuta]